MLIRNKLLTRLLSRQRYRTLDRESVEVLTSEQIGPKRAKTPEGFLLCQEVPVARVGEMVYGEGEIPLKPGPDGTIRVTRGEEDLFDERALASYVGKPVVDEHPDIDVTPANWKKLTIGIVLNPRRGVGDDSDVMLADLLITDAAAIRDVEAGKREVSAGYEADYEQDGPGKGRQTNIIGNHVALVERGRCGPRCAIGDHQPKELQDMPTKTKTTPQRATFADRLRKVFADAGEELADAVGNSGIPGSEGDDGDDNGDTHIHIHTAGDPAAAGAAGEGDPTKAAPTNDDPVEMRFAALEQGHQDLSAKLDAILAKLGGGEEGAQTDPPPAGEEDPDKKEVSAFDGMPDEVEAANRSKTGDSMALEASFKAVLADAEILVPGFRLPTFDAKTPRKATMDSMCGTRRSVLNTLMATADGAALVNTVSGTPVEGLDKMPCVAVATLFRAAAGAKRLLNNSAGTRDAHRLPVGVSQPGTKAPMTLAQLNKLHQQHHATHA